MHERGDDDRIQLVVVVPLGAVARGAGARVAHGVAGVGWEP